MKTLTAFLLAGTVIVASSPALAGRDALQMRQIHLAMEAKKAQQFAEVQKPQPGLAGATGIPGKVGPGAQAPKPKRDPFAHP